MQEKTTAITGSLALSGGAYISGAAMFAVSILFARFLEKDTFGMYLFVISLAAMVYLFTDFGIDALSYYFVARNKSKRMDLTKSVIYLSVKIKLILTSLVLFSLIVLGIADYRYWYVAAFFIVFVPNQYTRMFLESFQHFRLIGQLQIMESIFKLVLIYVVLEYITTTQLSIILIAIMLPMSISAFFAARDILISLPKTPLVGLHDLKDEAYHYGKWFTLGSILTPVISNVMQVTLGLLSDFTVLAGFGVGKTLSNMVLIFGTSFKSAIIPSFLKKTDVHSIGFSLTDSIRYTLIISVFLAFLIHFIALPLVTLFYTSGYSNSAIIFEILSYGILFSIIFIGVIPAATSIGKPDLSIKINVINVIVISMSAFLLIPKYGAVGAALSSASGDIISMGLFAIVLSKYLSYRFPWKTLIKCVFAGAFAILPLQLLSLPPIPAIVGYGGIGLIIYITILYIIREIKKEDVELFQSSMKIVRDYLKF